MGGILWRNYKLYGLQLEPNQMKDLIINVNGKDRLETFLELDRGRKRKALILFDADYEHNGGKALNFKNIKVRKYKFQEILFTEEKIDSQLI
ncbi:MAG: hypothetical protein IPN15_14115 [Saprospiraceae bacterium]|nr:hypothetical protein [Candidatus Vicinibacter affinis]